MQRTATYYLLAALGVAVVAWLTSALLPILGLASSAMLFLLPVLFAAARGGLGPGLVAALIGAAAYNYFLLPPRFTFRVHGLDNIVSVAVLVAVALVTSRLATRLKASERIALARADANEEAAELSALFVADEAAVGLELGRAWLGYQTARSSSLLTVHSPDGDAGFSSCSISPPPLGRSTMVI